MTSQLVYSSSESDFSDSENVEKEIDIKLKSRKIDWSLVLSFESEKEAKDHVKNEWSTLNSDITGNGKTVYMYCKQGGRRCPARMKMVINVNNKCILWFNGSSHFHFTKTLSKETKEEILNLLNVGVQKPNAIMRQLGDKGKTVPLKSVVINFLAYHKKKLGDRMIFVRNLEKFCNDYEDVPIDMDKFYVVKYEISEDGPSFRMFMSTKRLLLLSTYAANVATDATYKVCHNRYPLFLFGVVDQRRKFHPAGVMLACSETSEDYSFGFSALMEGVAWVHAKTLEPKVLIADSAEAIENGFKETFGSQFTRVNCWAHCNRAYEKRLKTISAVEIRTEINEDILKLQLCSSSHIFTRACKLWEEKWSQINNDAVVSFVTYFTDNWIKSNCGWFEGHAPGHPSTNNALESTYRIIKDEFTLRSALPLGDLMACIVRILESWSTNRNPTSTNYHLYEYNHIAALSLPLLTSAYNWVKGNPHILTDQLVDNLTTYFFAAKGSPKVTRARIKQLSSEQRHLKWKVFKDFVNSEWTVWKLTFKENDFLTSALLL